MTKSGIEASHQTVCNILSDNGFNCKRVKICHSLSDDHRKEIIDYIHTFNRSPKAIKFIYSKESIFSIDKFNSFQWVNGTDITGVYEKKEIQYTNRQCHVWAGISQKGKTDLYVYTSTVDSKANTDSLSECLLPFKKKIKSRSYLYLVQDGARCHTSYHTLDFCDDSEIKIIKLPPWSPDLNPMGLIWNIMKYQFKKKVIKKQFTTNEQIKNCLEEIWTKISTEDISNCINYVNNKMERIIQNNGNYLL